MLKILLAEKLGQAWVGDFFVGSMVFALTVNGEKISFWDRGRLLLVKAVGWRLHLPLTPLTLPLTDLFKQPVP
jgi:hypothetical protein